MTLRTLPAQLARKLINQGPRETNSWARIALNGQIHYGTTLVVPIFSLRTSESTGIGEFPDIVKIAEWAKSHGIKRILILPITARSPFDTSDSPYSPISLEALDSVHLRLAALPEVRESNKARQVLDANSAEIKRLNNTPRVDYAKVRELKDKVLRAAFEDFSRILDSFDGPKRFAQFCSTPGNEWLNKEFAPFAAMNNHFEGEFWRNLNRDLPDPKSQQTIDLLGRPKIQKEMRYQKFVQWLAERQWNQAIKDCEKMGVHIIDDLPHLPAQHSHNVYFNQDYYHLHLSAGAPSDQYAVQGQKWGNYPRDIKRLHEDPSHFTRPLTVMARRGIHGARADHIFGLFDPFYIRQADNPDYPKPFNGWRAFGGYPSQYRPHGRFMLEQLLSTGLEVCGENLGRELRGVKTDLYLAGISGMPIVRWERQWRKEGAPFVAPRSYGELNWAGPSIHDSSTAAGHLDNLLHPDKIGHQGISQDLPSETRDELRQAVVNDLRSEAAALARFWGYDSLPASAVDVLYGQQMAMALDSNAWQTMVPLGDALGLAPELREEAKHWRINTPGTVNTPKTPTEERNWGVIYPLGDLLAGSGPARTINARLQAMLQASGRAE
ncbi:4-alpha-glucanotransferase [Candidatus Margulisiibacteriota bacterium]